MNENKKLIPFMKGYKATNSDMTCTPKQGIKFQFEMNKFFEHNEARKED